MENQYVGYGHTVYQIRALQDFGDVKKGDLGGCLESENNLSHDGNCWIYPNSVVFGNISYKDDVKIMPGLIIGNTFSKKSEDVSEIQKLQAQIDLLSSIKKEKEALQSKADKLMKLFLKLNSEIVNLTSFGE